MRGFWFWLFYLASFGEWSVAGGSDQSGYGHNAMGEQHRENDVNYVRGFFGFDGLSSPTCRSGNALRANSTMARQCPQCHDVHLLGVESDLTGSLFGCKHTAPSRFSGSSSRTKSWHPSIMPGPIAWRRESTLAQMGAPQTMVTALLRQR